MDHHQIHNAMLHLDPLLIQEAAEPVIHKKRKLRPLALAACLLLLIAVPVMAVTGSLLVEHYYGDTIPDNLERQNLDAFFRANTAEKVPISELSQEALDAVAAQEDRVGHYGFDTWDAAEEFLGLNILDSDKMQNSVSVPVTDKDGRQLLRSPCHLALLRNDENLLIGMNLAYYFKNLAGSQVSLNVNAVTDQSPYDNNSSIGVSNESAYVVQQISEDYLTETGYQTTIISTEYSDGHGWDVAGWTQKNGFVIRFSLSTPDQESGICAIRDLLESIQ